MSQEIDPRGPQFAAALTSIVLATVLVTAPGAVALVLLGAQAVLFAVGASLGVTAHAVRLAVPAPGAPAAGRADASWRTRRRRSSPRPWGSASRWSGSSASCPAPPLVGLVATGLALVAALLNAVFGFCLGCEIYLSGAPCRHPLTRPQRHPPHRIGEPHEPRHLTRHRPVGGGPSRRPGGRPRSRSTRTPRPTTRATSRARSSSTGPPTCRTRSAATSSARRSSRRCSPSAGSPTTTPWCCTAATTTGSRPTPTGTSSSTATRT